MRVRLARRFSQDEPRKVSRPDRLCQHGQGDLLRRTRREVARVRELPAKCRGPAARRARRLDDAERAAISDRRLWRARAGYVVVNCNPLYSPRELKHQLADLGAEAIVVLENFATTLEKAIGGTAVKTVIVTGAGDQLGGAKGALVNLVVRHVRRAVPAFRLPRAIRFNRALALGSRQRFTETPIAPDDIAFLQYTGGTTGVPKGAMLTHRNMVANLRQIHAWLAPAIEATGEMFVAALPLYHVFALQVNGFVPLMIGASNLMIANPRDIPALVKALRRRAVHGHSRRQHFVQRAHQQQGFRRARLFASASGDRRRHGGAAGGRRALAIRDRQTADRSLWTDRDLSRRDRQSAEHRSFQRRDRPAAALDRDRHSRR